MRREQIDELGREIHRVQTQLSQTKRDRYTPGYADWRDQQKKKLQQLKDRREALMTPDPARVLLLRTTEYLKDVRRVLDPDVNDDEGFDLLESIEEYLDIKP